MEDSILAIDQHLLDVNRTGEVHSPGPLRDAFRDWTESPMAGTIKAGTILIEEGTLFPDSVRFESESYSTTWRSVQNLDGDEVARQVRAAGWNFFFLAGEVKGSAFGLDVQAIVRKAIARLTAKPQSQKFNCLQLTRVAFKHFLGFPYVSVSGHWRHIQKSMFLPAP